MPASSFFRRLFAPDTIRLETELEKARQMAEWYRRRMGLAEMNDEAGRKELAAEVRRNRKREDELQNRILEIAAGTRLAARIPEEQPPPQQNQRGLSAEDEAALRSRAREYAEQVAPEGTLITPDFVEQQFQMMLANPDFWLSD